MQSLLSNTSMKLIHQVPRSTFTYLVEGYLAGGETSLRNQVLARVPGFLISLLESPSAEVRFLSRVVAPDGGSVTSQNVRYFKKLTGLSPLQYGGITLKCALATQTVPPEQHWRLGLLSSLLSLRREKFRNQEETDRVESMLASRCNT